MTSKLLHSVILYSSCLLIMAGIVWLTLRAVEIEDSYAPTQAEMASK
ncbi:MAG: hypothetical protein PHC68_14425 [Syntrophorhabdaceae bacterium]|nr:hypothetical protein [Syntrophorhabdaceae bacterium]